MMNVNQKINSVMEYMRDATNPFVRLVNNAMSCGGNAIPYYQMEEVREASFQSDHACEMIVKALSPRLEDPNAVTVNKSLSLLRLLFLEGAAGVRSRSPTLRPALCVMAHSNGVPREGVAAANRDLAAALLRAMDGDGADLAGFSSSYVSGTRDAPAPAPTPCRSEFEMMRQRERRAYRRQCEAERQTHASAAVGLDPNLSAPRLVEAVIANPRKRLAQTELDAFANAAVARGAVGDVCAALEQHLAGRQSLQNRFKVLQVVDALVGRRGEEALGFFRANRDGVRRHLGVSAGDNPIKAEAARTIAQHITHLLQEDTPTQTQTQTQTQIQPTQASLWEWGTTAAGGQQSSSVIDDLFAENGSSGAPTQPPPPQPSQSLGALRAGVFDSTNSNLMPQQAPPHSHQHQQQEQLRAEALLSAPNLTSSRRSASGITALSPIPPPTSSPSPSQESPVSWQQQMAEAQRNMQAMMSMMTVQAPTAATEWTFNNSAPGKPPQEQQQQVAQEQTASPSPSLFSTPAPAPTQQKHPELDLFGGVHAASPQTNLASDNDKLRLMQQLQAQMEATQRILEQQQAAFMTLQAELQKK